MAGEWKVTFPNGSSENYNADRLFVTVAGVLIFTDIMGKRQVPYLAFAPGEWKKVVRVAEAPDRPT